MLAIAFALRGTLTRAEHLERDAFIQLVRERCEALGRPDFAAHAAAAAGVLFPPGGLTQTSLGELAATAKRLLDDPVNERMLIARFRQIAGGLVPDRVTSPAGVRETLERLTSLGIPMAVLCNGWSRIAQREAAYAGFAGPVLVSEDMRADVPQPRAFAKLVETLRVPAERVWFVGNDPDRDIAGAIDAGLTAVWYNPGGSVYPAHRGQPALTVRSFEELLPPLCEEYTRSLLSLRHLLRTALEWRDGHVVAPFEKW